MRLSLRAGLRVAFLILIFAGITHAGEVIVLTYAGPIGSVSAEYVSRGIAEAEARGAAVVILQLDTPGGLDSSMRRIIQREMNARVPVVVYVAPRGARAASAGCLIVLAADVAAMAPGTNIGAAHPVDLSGGPVSEKILNDAVAYAHSLAAAHGRNETWAEQAVRESASIPALEAVRLHVVDLAANDLNDLIRQLNGQTVHNPAHDVTFTLAGVPQVPLAMNWRERLFNTLANPNVAYLLFLLGVLTLIVEVFAPHGMATGTLGVLAVILAVIGLANLPIQLSGALLLILGMILLVLELKITSHGVLTVVGLIAFIFGSVLLFPDIPGYHLSRWAIGTVAVLWAVLLGVVVRLALKARRGPMLLGVERLVGAVGVTKTELAPRGVVLLGGEDWDARADPSPVGRGERVQVLEVQGLTLRVRKLS